jgi:transcriptional regulator with XRE-family HTH domain
VSQYELAKRAGVTRQALSLLEMGEREPNWETVQRLSAALGVDCREFVDPGLKLPEREPSRPRGRPPKAAPATPPAGKLEKTTKKRRSKWK